MSQDEQFEQFMNGLQTRTLQTFKVCHILQRNDGTYLCLDINVEAATVTELKEAIRQHFAQGLGLDPAPRAQWRAFFDGENVDASNIRPLHAGRGFAIMPIRKEIAS